MTSGTRLIIRKLKSLIHSVLLMVIHCLITLYILEETALNETSCIQVLSILMGKADDDVIELEEELMELVTQLACADEEFSDMFCTSLRVKSDFLDQSIRKLKDGAHDFSLSSREPAESLDDMLKSLFCCYSQKKDQQKFADNTSVASCSYHQVHSDELSRNNKQNSGSSNANRMGKSTNLAVTPLEKRILSQAKVKVEEPNADYPRMTPVSEYTSGHFKRSMLDKNSKWNIVKIKSPIITTDVPINMTGRCKSICQKSKTKGNWNDQLKMVKSQPDDDENIDYTSNCLVEVSQETNAKQNNSDELGFYHGNPNPEDNQEPKTSFSQTLCLVDPSSKPKTNQNGTKEPGFFHGNSDPEDNREPKATFSQSPCLADPSMKPKPKPNGTKELGFFHGKSDPNYQESKTSLSKSLSLLESSQKPKLTDNITKQLGFFHGNYNSKNHQEPKVSLSESLYSTKTYKRRKQRLSSPFQISSSSVILLEEPKPLAIIDVDVDVDVSNLHDMDYYTVEDMKVIARQRNLRGYSKLRKAELAHVLGIKVTEGRRRQKRKETLSSSKDKGYKN
ncbi:uncharacterized protein [Rutidosis leptorrhynchoides]|uniref:uncharacterized protein isoform X2 n=1 Tax=Rutidosis leptorrhynchoides TaxID=125765 RepID=UPI003A996174